MDRRGVKREALATQAAGGEALPRPYGGDRAAGLDLTSALLPPLLVAAATVTYWNSFSGMFIVDLVETLQHTGVHSLEGLSEIVSTTSRPIPELSLALNYRLGGQVVRGYHAVNLWVHITASLALFGIVRRTLSFGPLRLRYGPHATWLAFAAALIWMLHPLQTQAVTFIVQRAESMMGMFLLLTLYCAIRCAQGELGSRARYAWGMGAAAACWLGMATKEVMAVAPLIVLFYDRTFLSTSFRESLRKRWGLHLAVAAGWGVLLGIIGAGAAVGGRFARPDLETVSRLEYALTQPGVICHYLRLAVWPHPLCFDYYWPVAKGVAEIAVPGLVIGALVVGSAWALWRGSWLGFLGASFFTILAPTSSVYPLPDMALEHRMYLPLAPVVVLASILAWELLARLGSRRSAVALALLFPVASLLAYGTVQRNFDYWARWKLWQSVVEAQPDNPRAHYKLATLFKIQDKQELAVAHFSRAVALEPTSERHYALGQALQWASDFHGAIRHYQEAVRLDPTNLRAQVVLAAAYHSIGEFEVAIEHYRDFLKRTESADPGVDPMLPKYREDASDFLEKALQRKGHIPKDKLRRGGAVPIR